MQVLGSIALMVVENLPARQPVHIVDEDEDENVPAAQLMHALLPWVEKVPAEQMLQPDPMEEIPQYTVKSIVPKFTRGRLFPISPELSPMLVVVGKPRPSCPMPLVPQHLIVLSVRIAHVAAFDAVTFLASNPVPRLTRSNAAYVVEVLPRPTCPEEPCPQHWISFVVMTKQVCVAPAETCSTWIPPYGP